MKLRNKIASVALSAVLALLPIANADSIRVANWNLCMFGNKKASQKELLESYARIIQDYEIIFLQEIRNKNQAAIPRLAENLPGYNWRVSSRAGSTNTKEQYAVFYKSGIKITDFNDFNPDPKNRWERPPIKVTFSMPPYKFSLYNIHTKPENTSSEIESLEALVSKDKSKNIIVLGDLNASCGYYNPKKENIFSSWFWAIGNDEDTTVSDTHCAFDRIILDDDAKKEYKESGVCKEITKELSDHYLVWARLETVSPLDYNKDGIVNFKDFAISPPKDFRELSRFAGSWMDSP